MRETLVPENRGICKGFGFWQLWSYNCVIAMDAQVVVRRKRMVSNHVEITATNTHARRNTQCCNLETYYLTIARRLPAASDTSHRVTSTVTSIRAQKST